MPETTSETRHTIQSVGETVERHYKEFKAFAGQAEAKTDKALRWWEKTHWSALIGITLLFVAAAFGGWLARLV